MVGSTILGATRTLVKTIWDNQRKEFLLPAPESSRKFGFSTNIQDLIKAMISVPLSYKS